MENIKAASSTLILIKFFSKEEHYLAFRNGNLLLRTPHFYRTCEDPGRGDTTESCIAYWDKELGHEIPDLVLDGSPMDMANVKSVLIYPADEQHDAWLQSWCSIDSDNNFEESLQQMIDEFGSYFVLLSPEQIDAYADLLEQASGLAVRHGLVNYSENPLDRSLTVKSSKFSYQKEFRFFVGECPKGERQDKEIRLESLDKLLVDGQSLKFVTAGKTTYFGLGYKTVVRPASAN